MTQYFKRKWKIIIYNEENPNPTTGENGWVISDSESDDNPLKCTFSVEQSVASSPWFAMLTIWNLAGDTLTDIITATRLKGASAIIEAGYQDGPYGKIFDGKIFQPLFDRENVTDYKLTLYCIDGLGITTNNLCAYTLEKGYDYAGMIIAMAQKAYKPFTIAGMTDNIDAVSFPRSKTFFGTPDKYLRQMIAGQKVQSWIGNGELNINSMNDLSPDVALVLTPESGLVGVPQQTTNGISFRTFLDARIKIQQPLMNVEINNTVIIQSKQTPGSSSTLPTPLDLNGQYKVFRINRIGDTRGNDWYNECLGINIAGNVNALLGPRVN